MLRFGYLPGTFAEGVGRNVASMPILVEVLHCVNMLAQRAGLRSWQMLLWKSRAFRWTLVPSHRPVNAHIDEHVQLLHGRS